MGKTALILMVTAAVIVLPGCGHGGPGGARGGMGMRGPMGPGLGGTAPSRELQLRRFDADADGQITADEFARVTAADYAVADASHDGKLSTSEAWDFNAKIASNKDVSPIIDWNADGNISVEEFSAQWRTLFARADANHDGVVTADELSRPQMEGPGDGRPPGGRGGPGGPGGGGPGRPSGGGPGGGLTTQDGQD